MLLPAPSLACRFCLLHPLADASARLRTRSLLLPLVATPARRRTRSPSYPLAVALARLSTRPPPHPPAVAPARRRTRSPSHPLAKQTCFVANFYYRLIKFVKKQKIKGSEFVWFSF